MRPHQTRNLLRGVTGQAEGGGDPRDQSSGIRCSWRGPTRHHSLQEPPRAEPACLGLLSRELSCSSDSWPNHHLCVKSSWSLGQALASLSQTAQRAGPALVLLGTHSGSGAPRHAGRTQQLLTLLGASPLLIRANIPEGALSACPRPTPLHGRALWASAYDPAASSTVGAAAGSPEGRRVAATEPRGHGPRSPPAAAPPGTAAAQPGLPETPAQPGYPQRIRRANGSFPRELRCPRITSKRMARTRRPRSAGSRLNCGSRGRRAALPASSVSGAPSPRG